MLVTATNRHPSLRGSGLLGLGENRDDSYINMIALSISASHAHNARTHSKKQRERESVFAALKTREACNQEGTCDLCNRTLQYGGPGLFCPQLPMHPLLKRDSRGDEQTFSTSKPQGDDRSRMVATGARG